MYLGIDLGTSSVKIILMNEAQQIVASSTSPLNISRPKPLWSEQNPHDWWTAVERAFQSLKHNHTNELKQLRAIGLSGQMHGATLLDKQNQPLRPAILWNDGRSFNECHTLKQRISNAEHITGNLLFPGFTAPKLLWIKQHEPDVFQKIHKIVLPKDYIRLKLTNTHATDLSDASGTSWLDVKNRCWSTEMIEATNLSLNQMPELFEGTDITATVSRELALSWGIPKHTVVVGGGGDNAASAISMNVINNGQAFLSLGTSGVYFVADDCYRPCFNDAIHTMCHCLPNRWHEMNVHLSAASCLSWFAENICQKPLEQLLHDAEKHHQQNTPLFLPHLGGERTPYNNPHAHATFFGMTHATTQSTLMQSVLEGVSLLIAQGQQALLNNNVVINEINIVGGGAHSHYWGRILASALDRTLTYRHSANIGGSLGAAKLAWLGINGGEPHEVLTTPDIDTLITPQPSWVATYQHKLDLFKQLYRQVEPLFQPTTKDEKNYEKLF